MNETMKIIFGLVGGLAIFIYGMNMMSECLQKAAGEKMKKILALLTKNPILGVLAGALTTAVLQSSSATTVMTIGFVSAGLMSLPQAISIILGANIGTTMTAQIIAFKISDYIYLFIFVGFLISFISKKEKVKNIGQTIFAFGLLFLGIETMGDVMKPLASSAFFVNMIGKVSHIPILGVCVGAMMTLVVQSSSATIAVLQNFASQAVLQSSSATTVMTIGFVSAGLMSLPQAISIILGANIGTTMTAQIIAFKISDYIYLFIFVGFLISFISKKEKVKNIGQTIFAFGLLFLGIETMGDVMKPLASSAFFVNMIGKVSHIPILGVCVGAMMTLVVQSSSATIAVLQNFASQAGPDGVTSIIGLAGAIPILLGDNIGTTITAVLASIGQPKDARRTAFAHCVFNISGAILFLFLVKPYAALIQFISPKGNEIDVISRQIANAHTGFNLVMTLIWIPLIPLMVKIVMKLVPDGKEMGAKALENPNYLDNKLIAQPAAALQLVAKEVMYCAKIVDEMIGKLQSGNGKIDKENAGIVEEKAKILQKLYASINDYFAALYSGGVLTEEQASQSAGMQSILCDIDRIGQLTREIMETVAKQNKGKHKYSKEALKELKKAMEQIQMIYGSCIRAISGDVDMDIKELMRQKEDIMQLDEKMRKNHIARVGKGKCDSKLTIPFNDVLHNIDRIGNSCVNLVEVAKENVTMQAFFAED